MEAAIKLVVENILAKKELSNLSEEFVLEKVKKFLETHKKVNEKIKKENYLRLQRSKEYKELVKTIRAELRKVYGVFILKDYKKRYELLKELKKNPSIENHNKILGLHKSSKERLPYYSLVYKKIFKIAGVPKRIIDLACGLNPFSYPFLGCKPEYVACDLSEKDLDFIKKYFKAMKIKGKTKRIDLIKDKDKIKMISKNADVVFLFKTLDSLETIKRNISWQVLRNIQGKFIVVSFSTKSLGGGKIIRKEKRAWFERLIKKLGYRSKIFEIPGETFYIITK